MCMYSYNKYIAILAMMFCFLSCNDELYPESNSKVKINASIAAELVTRVSDDGTRFTDGDVVRVVNLDRSTDNLADYTYSESTNTWNTTDNLLWEGREENHFNAWHPASATYTMFSIPSDQSQGISFADWMTASATASQSVGSVNFAFSHLLAKVTVHISGWGTEYAEAERVVNSVKIATVSRFVSKNGEGEISGNGQANMLISCPDADGYSAIVAPGLYAADTEIMHISVTDVATPLVVKTSSDMVLESGKAYRFNVRIGKDAIVLDASDVVVIDWVDQELMDQELIPDSETPGSYTVQLTSSSDAYGWKLSTTVSNPDASEYDGVYESTNKAIDNSQAYMYIDIDGYDVFKVYVRSNAETSYDYVVVSNPDCQLSSSTTSTSNANVKMTTSGKQTSVTSISGYTLVEFTGLAKTSHRITIMFRKDSSVANGDDKGYVLIPKNQ